MFDSLRTRDRTPGRGPESVLQRARRPFTGPRHERALRAAGVVVTLHVAALLAYLLVRNPSVLAPRYLAYPVVWVGLTAYAVVRVPWDQLRRAPRRLQLGALVVGVGYVGLVAGLTGLVGPASEVTVARLVVAPPGWGPILLYDGSFLAVRAVPFTAIGSVGLGVLVGFAVAGAGRSLLGGALGLFTCVGCTLSAVGALVAVVIGGGSTIASLATGATYDLSTAVFVVSVLVLVSGVATE